MSAYLANGVRLYNCLQEASLSVPGLVRRIQEVVDRHGPNSEFNDVTAKQIYDMLAERHRFTPATFRSVACALGLDDHLSLTRRNGFVYHLTYPEEHNARIELIRLLHLGAIPADADCLFRYVTYGVSAQTLPTSLLAFDISHLGWRRIMESLCPAGLVEVRGGEYRLLKPSTEECIGRTRFRCETLLACNKYLFDPDTAGQSQRRVVASQLLPIIAQMRKARSIEEYCELDADAQLTLSGGDYTLYRHLLIDVRSLRLVIDRLNVKRRDTPGLQFPPEFQMSYRDWSERFRDDNTLRLEQLMKLYERDETTEEQTRAKIEEIVEPTVANIMALDNALEFQRGTRHDARRYKDVSWPAAQAVPSKKRRARRAHQAHAGKSASDR